EEVMEELLKQLLSKELPIMQIELSKTFLGFNLKGGFTKLLDVVCEQEGLKKEEVEALYFKYLKQPLNDFGKAFYELLDKAGVETEMVDNIKED
uniref:hypothetical protein n=1 Tax=Methanobrevibacter sp. TaxID=66852 RepID=UPI00388D0CD7